MKLTAQTNQTSDAREKTEALHHLGLSLVKSHTSGKLPISPDKIWRPKDRTIVDNMNSLLSLIANSAPSATSSQKHSIRQIEQEWKPYVFDFNKDQVLQDTLRQDSEAAYEIRQEIARIESASDTVFNRWVFSHLKTALLAKASAFLSLSPFSNPLSYDEKEIDAEMHILTSTLYSYHRDDAPLHANSWIVTLLLPEYTETERKTILDYMYATKQPLHLESFAALMKFSGNPDIYFLTVQKTQDGLVLVAKERNYLQKVMRFIYDPTDWEGIAKVFSNPYRQLQLKNYLQETVKVLAKTEHADNLSDHVQEAKEELDLLLELQNLSPGQIADKISTLQAQIQETYTESLSSFGKHSAISDVILNRRDRLEKQLALLQGLHDLSSEEVSKRTAALQEQIVKGIVVDNIPLLLPVGWPSETDPDLVLKRLATNWSFFSKQVKSFAPDISSLLTQMVSQLTTHPALVNGTESTVTERPLVRIPVQQQVISMPTTDPSQPHLPPAQQKQLMQTLYSFGKLLGEQAPHTAINKETYFFGLLSKETSFLPREDNVVDIKWFLLQNDLLFSTENLTMEGISKIWTSLTSIDPKVKHALIENAMKRSHQEAQELLYQFDCIEAASKTILAQWVYEGLKKELVAFAKKALEQPDPHVLKIPEAIAPQLNQLIEILYSFSGKKLTPSSLVVETLLPNFSKEERQTLINYIYAKKEVIHTTYTVEAFMRYHRNPENYKLEVVTIIQGKTCLTYLKATELNAFEKVTKSYISPTNWKEVGKILEKPYVREFLKEKLEEIEQNRLDTNVMALKLRGQPKRIQRLANWDRFAEKIKPFAKEASEVISGIIKRALTAAPPQADPTPIEEDW